MAIDEVYEQTLAALTERYGKRIAYYQSLPLISNVSPARSMAVASQTSASCPILEGNK
jgi:hypothetical protein